jgi:nucleoside-diphosphate-sugar epimerase
MKVLVTGGTGFIGRRLVKAILDQGALTRSDGSQAEVDRVVVADVAEPQQPMPEDARIATVYRDFSEPGAAEALLGGDTDVVFHLAAIVSGQAEQEFDLGMRINLQGTERLLDACRALATPPRLVFASSVAVYGGDLPPAIRDDTPLTPQTSYGIQKSIGELLVQDYSRKGFIDGRALRLPTIVVRPGKPNAAASSFASAVVREPLQGDDYACPVGPATAHPLHSPRTLIRNLLHAEALAPEAFGSYRGVLLPALTATVGDMVDTLRQVGGDSVADRVRYEPDPFIEKIVAGWPVRLAGERAGAMGFEGDTSLRDIVEAFIEDDLGGDFVH